MWRSFGNQNRWRVDKSKVQNFWFAYSIEYGTCFNEFYVKLCCISVCVALYDKKT